MAEKEKKPVQLRINAMFAALGAKTVTVAPGDEPIHPQQHWLSYDNNAFMNCMALDSIGCRGLHGIQHMASILCNKFKARA
jgi:hypothetical protein